MKRVFRKPFVFWFSSIFLLYFVLMIFVSDFDATLAYLPYYFKELSWSKFLFSISLSLTIAFLVALTSVLGFMRFRERKVAKEGALLCVGSVGGFAAGVCPTCVTSVFPVVFSLFGVSFSWAFLPFGGVEIQVLTIGILLASLYWLRK